MENLGLSGLKDKEELQLLAGSASQAANHVLYTSFKNFKARAERLMEEQDSVCTDTQIMHTKLRRAMELMDLFETKLEQAVNEDEKLKLTDYEGSTPFQALDSEIFSSKTLCDQLAETLQHLTSETGGAEEVEKLCEEMLGENYRALDVFNCMLHNLIIKADRGYQQNISGKLEETDDFHKENLYATDVAIEKDPPIKQLGNSDEENAKSIRPSVKFGSRGCTSGNYRRRVLLDCMSCQSDTSEIYRTCCDRVYCQLCARSCCEHSANPSYSTNLSSTVPGATPFPDVYTVPEPYPSPPFPYFFYEAHTFLNQSGEEDNPRIQELARYSTKSCTI